jgi:arylsulfatase A-like enzyme
VGSFSFAQRPLGAEHETLAELLASRGYSTAAIVANFGWVSEFFGLLQGFQYVDNRPMNLFNWEPAAAPYLRRLGWEWLNERYILLNKSAFFADSIVEHVREWESQRPPAPFFLLLNFMDAHAPFRASLLTDGFPGRLPELDPSRGGQSYSMARYDRSIAYLDQQVGELFEFLRSRDLYDDSLIVVTSDHGENFDENRPAAHGADLLQATVAVPLIIKLPNQQEGSRPGRVGQLIDVVPTVREVLGLEVGEAMFGSPMARSPRAVVAENYFSALFGAYAADFEGTEEEMLAAFPSRWVLFEGAWKLERSASGASRLFDLAADPNGLVDVSGAYPDVSGRLEQRLSELLPETAFAAARFPSSVGLPDRQTVDRLRSLGYLR